MKQNQKNRYNGRYNGRNSRTLLTRNTALESTGPMGKLHGTALQLFEKYQAYSKDALIQNDLILAQTCMQYADHYLRLQNIAILNEQSLRTNNYEQRPNASTSYAEKTEGDSLPNINTNPVEETTQTDSKEEQVAETPTEESSEEISTNQVPKAPKRTFVVRRKVKLTENVDSNEKETVSLSDDSVLNQDLSVPIMVMQENNQ